MKVLNLDKLATKQQRELVIAGVSYAIEEMTVSNFIETTKAAEKLAKATLAEQIQATMDMVVRSVPTIDKAVLTKLSLPQLQAIVAFVRGDDDVEGVESKPVEGEGEGAKK